MKRGNKFGSVLTAAATGAVAVWVMDRFDWFAFDHENPAARQRTEQVRPRSMDPAHALVDKAAAVAGIRYAPASPHRDPIGLAVHYAFPMALAILYDALRHRMPVVSKGSGTLYGLSAFLLLDEMINPLLGLAAAPWKYSWQRHAREMTAHLIFGVVTHAMLNAMAVPRGSAIKRSAATLTTAMPAQARNFDYGV